MLSLFFIPPCAVPMYGCHTTTQLHYSESRRPKQGRGKRERERDELFTIYYFGSKQDRRVYVCIAAEKEEEEEEEEEEEKRRKRRRRRRRPECFFPLTPGTPTPPYGMQQEERRKSKKKPDKFGLSKVSLSNRYTYPTTKGGMQNGSSVGIRFVCSVGAS